MRYCSGAWWDVAKAELPAIDYIGSYNYTVPQANALYNTGLPTTTPSETVAIPADPVLSGGYYLDSPGSGLEKDVVARGSRFARTGWNHQVGSVAG